MDVSELLTRLRTIRDSIPDPDEWDGRASVVISAPKCGHPFHIFVSGPGRRKLHANAGDDLEALLRGAEEAVHLASPEVLAKTLGVSQ